VCLKEHLADTGLPPCCVFTLVSGADVRRAEQCAGKCAGKCALRSCVLRTFSYLQDVEVDESCYGLAPVLAVSKSWSSFASSAEIKPISMRSSGLMNPSAMRKPPARMIASRRGTAQ
jgi:hypothetical protein